MPVITLETRIKAPIERCFDLARDIDLHMQSTAHTREVAVAGVTTGLIGPDEEVDRDPDIQSCDRSYWPTSKSDLGRPL